MDNVGYVATGYILTWVLLIWYAVRLTTRSRAAELELARGVSDGNDAAETTN
jgi:hypothetical protein